MYAGFEKGLPKPHAAPSPKREARIQERPRKALPQKISPSPVFYALPDLLRKPNGLTILLLVPLISLGKIKILIGHPCSCLNCFIDLN